MYYGVYKTARDGAWQCLLDHHITALPVPLKQIARNAGIKLVANSAVNLLSPTERGYAENVKGKWYIVFNDDDTPQAIRFTVAHELGHIFLGHALEKGYARSKRFIVKPQTETEADVFASRLLCPAVVLWGLNLHTADEIAAACNVSQAAARIRADVPHYRFHDLRHYTVSVMLSLNIPKNYIADFVGHETENMIDQVYGHILKSKKTSFEDLLQTFYSGVFTE